VFRLQGGGRRISHFHKRFCFGSKWSWKSIQNLSGPLIFTCSRCNQLEKAVSHLFICEQNDMKTLNRHKWYTLLPTYTLNKQ
jgi:hypothetical protein